VVERRSPSVQWSAMYFYPGSFEAWKMVVVVFISTAPRIAPGGSLNPHTHGWLQVWAYETWNQRNISRTALRQPKKIDITGYWTMLFVHI
jgi:hypothetical protein